MQKIVLLLLLASLMIANSAFDSIFNEAGEQYGINPEILGAVAETESGKDPRAINCANTNKSCDYGLMQINSIHLPLLAKYGIQRNDLFNPRISVFIGAWVLKNCINKHGQNYKALNCYNGKIKNNSYYAKVLKNYKKSSIKKHSNDFFPSSVVLSSKTENDSSNYNDNEVKNTPTRYKILLIGDSLAEGFKPAFKTILNRYNVEFISNCKSNLNINYWANQDIKKMITTYNPDYVFVALDSSQSDSALTEKIANDFRESSVNFKWISNVDVVNNKNGDYSLEEYLGKDNYILPEKELGINTDISKISYYKFKLWSTSILSKIFS